jgi:hypothetical protein
MAVRLSALRVGRPLPPRKIPGTLISVRGWVDPRAIVRLEGLGQLEKIPLLLSLIHIFLLKYCHGWLIITGLGLVDFIYWRHLLQSLLFTINDCLRLAPFWLDYDWLLICDSHLAYRYPRKCLLIILIHGNMFHIELVSKNQFLRKRVCQLVS